jgi:tRNA(Ile)-lysidine synthase
MKRGGIFIDENQKEVNIPLNLFCKVADISLTTNSAIFVDADKLQFL